MTTALRSVGLQRDQWHRYTWNGDGPLVGVTTPLKLQDTLMGGDLARWGAQRALDYILSTEFWNVDAALATVRAAREIGTEVHEQVAHILLGEKAGHTSRTAPYIYAFSSFLAKERPEFLHVETMVASLAHRFGGTFDFAAVLRGRLALVDVKTGKQKPSQRLQLAGYSAAEFIGKEGDPTKYPMPDFEAYYILLLRPEGYELVELPVTDRDREHFLYLVAAYHRIREWEQPR